LLIPGMPGVPGLPGVAQTAAPAPDSAAGEVEAKTARILAVYGSRLSAEQKQRVRRTVAGHVAMLERIRGEAMPNSAPPATVLKLVRGRRVGTSPRTSPRT
ncbi:MAG: hypothetical protein ACRD2D_06425, partial [Terriglobales bacterium]